MSKKMNVYLIYECLYMNVLVIFLYISNQLSKGLLCGLFSAICTTL